MVYNTISVDYLKTRTLLIKKNLFSFGRIVNNVRYFKTFLPLQSTSHFFLIDSSLYIV